MTNRKPFKTLWCEWFHRAGSIQRDDDGRINYRCNTCGCWADSPVPLATERRIVRAALAHGEADQ